MFDLIHAVAVATGLSVTPPATMHIPASPPPPQSCALSWADHRPARLECPEAPGLQAYAEARLRHMDLPPLADAVQAQTVTFEASPSPEGWRAVSGVVVYSRPAPPAIAVSNAYPAYCLVGGRVSETGALQGPRVACNAPGGEEGAMRQSYLAEVERFAAQVRILSDHPARCHVLPLRFDIEGGPSTPPAPEPEDVCPAPSTP